MSYQIEVARSCDCFQCGMLATGRKSERGAAVLAFLLALFLCAGSSLAATARGMSLPPISPTMTASVPKAALIVQNVSHPWEDIYQRADAEDRRLEIVEYCLAGMECILLSYARAAF